MASPHNDRTNTADCPSLDIPIDVDSERCPQRNEEICRHCRESGCACASGWDGVEHEGGGAEPVANAAESFLRPADAESDDGSQPSGEEGLAEHQIEVGDFGLVPVRVILMALAKHSRCTCHVGVLPESDDYPFSACNSLEASGMLSPCSSGSMIVELSGDDRSLSSSSLSRSVTSNYTRSTSPSGFLEFMGQHLEMGLAQSTPRNYFFTHTPLFLGHQASEGITIEYTDHISIGDSVVSSGYSDHSAYDFLG